MNFLLALAKRAQILSMLCKGSSMRLISRAGDGAVVDEQFNTTDVAIVLRAGAGAGGQAGTPGEPRRDAS